MKLTINLEPDADGYTGRECPTCLMYLKVKGGAGLPGASPSTLGRKVRIFDQGVRDLVNDLRVIADALYRRIARP